MLHSPRSRTGVVSMKSAGCVLASSFLAMALASVPVNATTARASIGVSATVQASCVVSASSMRFGIRTETQVTTSALSVQCTHPTPYNVGLSAGLAPGTTVVNRRPIGPALVGYSLQSNTRGIVNWGQTSGIDSVAATGNHSVQTLSVLGRISSAQHAVGDAPADTITVTLTY
jgi:spore coat protein U-like protein